MAITLDDYYTPGWREQRHVCAACDWEGTSRGMQMELHDELAQFDCPQCENPMLLVVHPSLEQVKAAAAAGNAEAREQLDILASFPRGD